MDPRNSVICLSLAGSNDLPVEQLSVTPIQSSGSQYISHMKQLVTRKLQMEWNESASPHYRFSHPAIESARPEHLRDPESPECQSKYQPRIGGHELPQSVLIIEVEVSSNQEEVIHPCRKS